MNVYKGRLKRWNEDKGFGFIGTDNDKNDIFIHISALKRMDRRPVIGDNIEYQIHIGNDGKKRAVNAKIEGVAEVRTKLKRTNNKHYKKSSNSLYKLIPIVLIIFIGFISYTEFIKKNQLTNTVITPISQDSGNHVNYSNQVNFSCDGKQYCSEMTSCGEARFYQNNCPGTRMDGDGDGIPCESQWCTW